MLTILSLQEEFSYQFYSKKFFVENDVHKYFDGNVAVVGKGDYFENG